MALQTRLLCVYVSHLVVFDSLQPHELQPTRLLCLWNSSGKNTGVGSHSFLQGIFSIKGLNLCLLHCRQILYSLSQQGNPDKLYTYLIYILFFLLANKNCIYLVSNFSFKFHFHIFAKIPFDKVVSNEIVLNLPEYLNGILFFSLSTKGTTI